MSEVVLGLGRLARRTLDRIERATMVRGPADVLVGAIDIPFDDTERGLGGRAVGRALLNDTARENAGMLTALLSRRIPKQQTNVYLVVDLGEPAAGGALLDLLVGLNGLLGKSEKHFIRVLGLLPGPGADVAAAAAYATIAELVAYREPSTAKPLQGLDLNANARRDRTQTTRLFDGLWLGGGGVTADTTIAQASQWVLQRIRADAIPSTDEPNLSRFGVWVADGAAQRAAALADLLRRAIDKARPTSPFLGFTPAALEPLHKRTAKKAELEGDSFAETDRVAQAVKARLLALIDEPTFWHAVEAERNLLQPAGEDEFVDAPAPKLRTADDLSPLALRRLIEVRRKIAELEALLGQLRDYEDRGAWAADTTLGREGRKAAADVVAEIVFERFDARLFNRITRRFSRLDTLADLRRALLGFAEGLDAAPRPSVDLGDVLAGLKAENVERPTSNQAVEILAEAADDRLVEQLLDLVETSRPGASASISAESVAAGQAFAERALAVTPGAGERRTIVTSTLAARGRRVGVGEVFVADLGEPAAIMVEAGGLAGDQIPFLAVCRAGFFAALRRNPEQDPFVRSDDRLFAPNLVIPASEAERRRQALVLSQFAHGLVLDVVVETEEGLVFEHGPYDQRRRLLFRSPGIAFAVFSQEATLGAELREAVTEKQIAANTTLLNAKLELLVGLLAAGPLKALDEDLGTPLAQEVDKASWPDRRDQLQLTETIETWSTPSKSSSYRILRRRL